MVFTAFEEILIANIILIYVTVMNLKIHEANFPTKGLYLIYENHTFVFILVFMSVNKGIVQII